MKSIIIIILIIYNSHNANSLTFTEFIEDSYNELVNAFDSAIKAIRKTLIEPMYQSGDFTTEKYIQAEELGRSEITEKSFDYFLRNMKIRSEVIDINEEEMVSPKPQENGPRVEHHVVTTFDGYILKVHRLVPVNTTTVKSKTVLIHHGLLGSSADWLLLGRNESLPYILSDKGYDVWLANARGNYYSRKHDTKKLNTPEFWKFTWQDIGQYDLPAVIDYIRSKKHRKDKIDFVGHSMGATALLVLLSTSPSYNECLKTGILIAPLVFMTEIKGPLLELAKESNNISEKLQLTLGYNGEVFPSRKVPEWLSDKFCSGPTLLCRNPLLFLSGGVEQVKSRNASFIARLLYHVPAGGSTDTILHYAQIIKNAKFHRFEDPSAEFNIRKVSLPISIFSSSDDWLSTIPDAKKLFKTILNPIDHIIIRNKKISHTEFVWGLKANELVFSYVIEILENGKITSM